MDWVGITGLIVGILTVLGTGIGWFLKWAWDRRKEDLQAIESRFLHVDSKLTACEIEREQIQAKFELEKIDLYKRISGLEASIPSQDIPCWRRTYDGVILTASKEFVRLFCAPFGIRNLDLVGKRFSDLELFQKTFVETLHEMGEEALKRGYSSRYGIYINSKTKVTIIKSISTSPVGDIVFVAYAVPESGDDHGNSHTK